jgi:hypothetical protein
MRQLAFIVTAGALSLGASWSSARAGGLPPEWYGEQLLVYGNASEAYAAGCLRWNFQQRSWYNYCRPTPPTPPVLAVKG